jgi:hypothetical protein
MSGILCLYKDGTLSPSFSVVDSISGSDSVRAWTKSKLDVNSVPLPL